MKTKIFLFILLSAILLPQAKAQNIDVSLPYFAGKAYTLSLWQGLRQDTIASGTLDDKGATRISIPQWHSDYRGMANFRLTGGGGIDLIITGENIAVSCSEKQPTIENIVIDHSAENDFLRREFLRGKNLGQRPQLLKALLQTYDSNTPFAKLLDKELQQSLSEQQAYDSLLVHSPLYAASFLKLYNYFDGIAQAYHKSPAEVEQLRVYGRDSLNVEAMYTSGLWHNIIDYWAAMYSNKYIARTDTAFAEDGSAILKRIGDQKIFEEFAFNLINICEMNSWNNASYAIADYISASGRINKSTRYDLIEMLRLNDTRPGKKAPKLLLQEGRKVALPELNRKAERFVLIFHETGCESCEREMQKLKESYAQLQAKGVEVVSVSSDMSVGIYKMTESQLPWKNHFCDLKGPSGENFMNYGIVGTPTIFVVDSKGVIVGKYAKVEDLKLE